MNTPTIAELLKMAESKAKTEWEFVDKLRTKNIINRTCKRYAEEWIKFDYSKDQQEKEKIMYSLNIMEDVFNNYLRHCIDVFDDDKLFKDMSLNDIIKWYRDYKEE